MLLGMNLNRLLHLCFKWSKQSFLRCNQDRFAQLHKDVKPGSYKSSTLRYICGSNAELGFASLEQSPILKHKNPASSLHTSSSALSTCQLSSQVGTWLLHLVAVGYAAAAVAQKGLEGGADPSGPAPPTSLHFFLRFTMAAAAVGVPLILR